MNAIRENTVEETQATLAQLNGLLASIGLTAVPFKEKKCACEPSGRICNDHLLESFKKRLSDKKAQE